MLQIFYILLIAGKSTSEYVIVSKLVQVEVFVRTYFCAESIWVIVLSVKRLVKGYRGNNMEYFFFIRSPQFFRLAIPILAHLRKTNLTN